MVIGPVLYVAFALITRTIPAPVLVVALRSVFRCGGFFSNPAVFMLVLGISVLGYGILALALIFLGCVYGVTFLGLSAYPTLRPSHAVAGFVGFGCGPPLWWSLIVCGGPSGAAELCLLSSCSVRGRLLLLEFASVPLPVAPAVFRGVSCHRLPLGGYATFLAPVACPAPTVELCLLGLWCL